MEAEFRYTYFLVASIPPVQYRSGTEQSPGACCKPMGGGGGQMTAFLAHLHALISKRPFSFCFLGFWSSRRSRADCLPL